MCSSDLFQGVFDQVGEEMLLYTMLSNLIKNALEASPQGGRVVIGLREGATLDVTVSNAGAVPLAIRPRFFEKFATAGKKDGTASAPTAPGSSPRPTAPRSP